MKKWYWVFAVPAIVGSTNTLEGYWPPKGGDGVRTVTITIKGNKKGWCYDINKAGLYISQFVPDSNPAILPVTQICVEKVKK